MAVKKKKTTTTTTARSHTLMLSYETTGFRKSNNGIMGREGQMTQIVHSNHAATASITTSFQDGGRALTFRLL